SIAAKNGLLIRNRVAFESAFKLDRVVFDKTGTLTEGNFGVTDIHPSEGISEEELLKLAYSVETQSDHPIAKGIVKEGNESNLKRLVAKNDQNSTRKRSEATKAEKKIAVTNHIDKKANKIAFDENNDDQQAIQGKTVVFLLKDNVLQGMIALADITRESS